jgi:cobalamin biosynthesis protein CbiG
MASLLCQVECVITSSWLDLDCFIAGLRASNVGALAEDLDKSVDSAFPVVALADNGVAVVSGLSGHLSESFIMPQC